MKKRNLNYLFALGVFTIGGRSLLDKIDHSAEFYIAKNHSRAAFDEYRKKFTVSYDFYSYAGYFGAAVFIDVIDNAESSCILGFLRGCAQSPAPDWCVQVYGLISTRVPINDMYVYYLISHRRYEVLDRIAGTNEFPQIIANIFESIFEKTQVVPELIKYLRTAYGPEFILNHIMEQAAVDEESHIPVIMELGLSNKYIIKMADHYSLYKIKKYFTEN